MIRFIQKEYTEYEAMRPLYVELQKQNKRVEVINTNSLIPILKGNNIVIERFVINKSMFGKDRFRMYLKIGDRAKMPEKVRLAASFIDKTTVLGGNLKLSGGLNTPKLFSEEGQKCFGKNKGGGNGDNNGGGKFLDAQMYHNYALEREKVKQLGDTILYDKNERTLVLEFDTIYNAVRALDILPFGLNYKLYLLDS